MAHLITRQQGRGPLLWFNQDGQWEANKAAARRFTDRAEADQFVATFRKQHSGGRARVYFEVVGD